MVERVDTEDLELRTFDWHGDIRSLHLQAFNAGGQPARVFHRRRTRDGMGTSWQVLELQPQESYRFILAKASVDELGPELAIPSTVKTNLHEVFDRAHYPTVAVESSDSQEDVAPLPLYPGKQLLSERS
jgi:pyruvate formate lyase activating enzyme